MLEFLPVPSWDALHPLIIHLPIGLLLIAPLFIVIGAVLRPSRGTPFLIAALVLIVAGTVSTYVAVGTGEAAGRLVERTPQINAVLHHHEELAERTRRVFTILSVLFAALVVVPAFFRQLSNRLFTTVLPLAFLVFYLFGAVLLVNTGHNGGRLVHEFGVHAIVQPGPAPATEAESDLR